MVLCVNLSSTTISPI